MLSPRYDEMDAYSILITCFTLRQDEVVIQYSQKNFIQTLVRQSSQTVVWI